MNLGVGGWTRERGSGDVTFLGFGKPLGGMGEILVLDGLDWQDVWNGSGLEWFGLSTKKQLDLMYGDPLTDRVGFGPGNSNSGLGGSNRNNNCKSMWIGGMKWQDNNISIEERRRIGGGKEKSRSDERTKNKTFRVRNAFLLTKKTLTFEMRDRASRLQTTVDGRVAGRGNVLFYTVRAS